MATATAPQQPVKGLDLGTSRIVLATLNGENVSYTPQLNAFVDIPYSRMTAAGLEALVSSPHVRGLKVLDVDFNRLGADGARVIAEAPNLAGWLNRAYAP